ncbi:unnamed protein product [Schistocephalus solidus]|uniref:Secreted protein n=1 Tax=Schistocephalus solidus TaxID=70667 RepID=A0A183T2J5_SCHSO|nr:unnamed protein product [Schistocephalus solidus]
MCLCVVPAPPFRGAYGGHRQTTTVGLLSHLRIHHTEGGEPNSPPSAGQVPVESELHGYAKILIRLVEDVP